MIKLPNSQDPAVIADNIVHLRDEIAEVDTKTIPATTTATTGQILGLTGENKTPAWIDNSGGSFLSLLTAQPVIQTKAKENDPNHDYILIKISDGDWVEYKYNELPDLSQYGIAISYASPSWHITCYNFFTIDGTVYIFYGNEITWQYQQELYDHTIAGYNIPINAPEVVGATPEEMKELEPEAKKTTKKKTTK